MLPRICAASVLLFGLTWGAAACNYSRVPTGRAFDLTSTAIRLTMTSVPPRVTPAPSPTVDAAASAAPDGAEPTFPVSGMPEPRFVYTTRPGDTLHALAGRFGLEPQAIAAGLPERTYLAAGQVWTVANALGDLSPAGMILPDEAFVYGPAAASFDVDAFVAGAGGYLARYEETLKDKRELTGAQIVRKVAAENSVDPRVLLAILEARGGWVTGAEPDPGMDVFPIGFRIPGRSGLDQELTVAATQLNRAYYGWRSGTHLEEEFSDGSVMRLHPTLNAGSVALIHLASLLAARTSYLEALAGEGGVIPTYEALFGRLSPAMAAEHGWLSPDLRQPETELPFAPGERWSLTAGPHSAWTAGTPRAALDLSPITGEEPCDVSFRWVTASAPGIVARAEANAVVLDLDGDGLEQTGWVILYYHLAGEGMVSAGTRVQTGDPLGHPSCEGGRSTGKHVHIVRRFNGEWMEADGPVPFVMSGWRAVADERNYYGSLVRGEEVVTSDSSGRQGSTIVR